jgi:hypothetical protein
MPYSLKGIDSVVFSVFNALGVPVTVRPILGEEAWDEYDECQEANYEGEEDYDDIRARKPKITRVGERFQKILMVDHQWKDYEDPGEVSRVPCYSTLLRPLVSCLT